MRLRLFNTFEPVAPIFRDLLPYLADRGHRVDVLVSSKSYRGEETREDRDGVSYRQMPTSRVICANPVLSKALTHATYSVSAGLCSLAGEPVDLNVFMTQPPLFSAWGGVLERARNQPYACIVMDLYPWVAIEAGVLGAGGPIARSLERIATRTLARARAIIVIGRCMADRVLRLGVRRERVHVINNWSNTRVVRPIERERNSLRREHGLGDAFTVMYSGNMGVSHHFGDIIEVARRRRNDDRLVFLFVGSGSRLSEVRQAIDAFGLPNVRCLGYQSPDALAESLSMGDVHFVSLRRGFAGLVVPSKAYGVMAAGRPMIYQGESGGEIARMIKEHDLGKVVQQGDVDGLEAAIQAARTDAEWRTAAGRRARTLSRGEYGMERALAGYAAALTAALRPAA